MINLFFYINLLHLFYHNYRHFTKAEEHFLKKNGLVNPPAHLFVLKVD
ncbi:hypothetical protein HMPREF9388_0177 [Streptococcus sanguinis SK353]|uniref:Uncharacterized protein n=1 Tax=Streptococcus sanguinis SK353 TaxID=888815 RepID=F0FBZ4_STRSA|nr:hypothetical protein HMPREF9398_0752 [Streptococcus sanguinis VMC66]EGC23268.1 hypothetical protein HMPREF9388_0177 [Streptococcus sanguinis SK353]